MPDGAHSVHVELAGLKAGHEYFYRFRAEGHISPVGRTRTTPNPNAMGPALTMCFASCSNWPAGFFTAYGALAAEEPDLVLHLGDYQYEGTCGAGAVRPVAGPETVSLAGYPAALRAVQDRSGPAGSARRRTLAGRVGRPRGRQQLRRRGPGEPPAAAARRVPRPAGRGVPGLPI